MEIKSWIALHLAGVGAFVLVGYALSRLLRRNDVADPLWGLGFVGIAVLQVALSPELTFRAIVILAMVVIWGLRLTLHLSRRVFLHSAEDPRYAAWRGEWGKREPVVAFFKVFLLQGVMMAVVALPISIGIRFVAAPLGGLDFLGVTLFLVGWIFEAVADAELAEFKTDLSRAGSVLNRGLWALCRHPNYFGEILIWWGIFCVAVSGGVWGVLSPLTITFLLVKVSGVPMLERNMKNKGPEFSRYCAETPMLIPVRGRELWIFLAIVLTMVVGDALWLGGVMKEFYLTQSAPIGRRVDGQWDVLIWAAAGVYLFLALGVRVFCVVPGCRKSAVRGAFFGLVTYGVYELTNLAMVRSWPEPMALVDLAWGVCLCAGAALVGSKLEMKFAPR